MPSIELKAGPDGEVINSFNMSAARDFVRLRGLSKLEGGVVEVIDYFAKPLVAGALPGFVKNFATADFGAAEYETLIRENLPAPLDIRFLQKQESERQV